MERLKELNRYQRVILILLAVMLVVFTVLYAVVSARVGYEYAGAILVPGTENGATVYSGTVRGEDAVITVTADKAVTVRWGSKVYGPYTLREDPTAIPEDSSMAEYMTGIEILEVEDVFFRGGVIGNGDERMVFAEDGTFDTVTITFSDSSGTRYYDNGKVYDEMKPTTGMILDLMEGPELTRKGHWIAWAASVFVSVITAITILFADDLFYHRMSFRVSNPQDMEPSELEIAGRYVEWTLLPIMALVVYTVGLVL